jgi:hypothetical protein
MVRPTLVKSEGGRTNFRRWARESRNNLVEAVFVSSCRDVGSERENEGMGRMAVTREALRIAATNGGGKRIRLNLHLCYSICASETRVSGYTEMRKDTVGKL